MPRPMAHPPHARLVTLPKQRPGLSAFAVANELVLLTPDGVIAHALNESAAKVWRLCDGQHTTLEMLDTLSLDYAGDAVSMFADLTDALLQFHHLGLIELTHVVRGAQEALAGATDRSQACPGPCVRFVFGVEDKSYFRWQLAILFESLKGQLPAGWDVTVVVCNDHQALSPELKRLVDAYGVRALTGINHAHSHAIDFASGAGGYVALNRVEALKAIADHVDAEDVVCLMDSDVFLYGELRAELFPSGNAAAANRIIQDRLFMGYGSETQGIDLNRLLAALGCERELKRGGVTVFMTGATLARHKVIQDCFRFSQILHLMGKVAGLPEANIWLAEMACFALALTANGIDYELLDTPQFAVPDPEQATQPAGTFFHYYVDVNDGHGSPFYGSEWNKQLFGDRDFLIEDLESFRAVARGDVEKRFLDLAIAARKSRHETPAS